MNSAVKYYFSDGHLFDYSTDIYIQPEGTTFYEVIRTGNGIPWFFDDHMNRLENGISTKYPLPEGLRGKIKTGIKALSGKEFFKEINLKVTVTFNSKGYFLFISFIDSFYPDRQMYIDGVKVITYSAVRPDPGVKIFNPSLRQAVDEQLRRTGAYEALLVNEKGVITEGSRSNIFFIDDGRVVTSPDYLVLPGVTRKHITEICYDEGIELIYKEMLVAECLCFRSAFITGTSPMILPVKSIDGSLFDPSCNIIRRLLENYTLRAGKSVLAYEGKI